MEFLTDYRSKMNKFKERHAVAKQEIEELEYNVVALNDDYQAAINGLEVEKANQLKQAIKQLESEIEVKKEVAAVLKAKSLSCDQVEAKKIEKNFNKYLDKKRKDAVALTKEVEKKRAEYIAAAKKVHKHNHEIRRAVDILINIPHKYDEKVWRPAYNSDITLDATKLAINYGDLQ